MDLNQRITKLQQLASEYGKTGNFVNRKSIKKESVKIYFEVEEELARIKYDLRLIDIRNYKDEEKEQLKLFPDFFADLLDIPDQPILAHVKQNALPIPLLLFLFYNHNKIMTALTSSAVFMDTVKPYLQKGDFQHLKSGSIRFITNTRFASDHLRRYGLLRTTKKEKYKYWRLSLFGIVIAAMIFEDEKFSFPEHFITDKHSFFFDQTLYTYTRKLLANNGLDTIINTIFKDEVVKEVFILKHKFIHFLSDFTEVIDKSKKDQNLFFVNYNDFLNTLDDELYARDLADGFLLNLPYQNKFGALMYNAFTRL